MKQVFCMKVGYRVKSGDRVKLLAISRFLKYWLPLIKRMVDVLSQGYVVGMDPACLAHLKPHINAISSWNSKYQPS
jgi:hypothetical protein